MKSSGCNAPVSMPTLKRAPKTSARHHQTSGAPDKGAPLSQDGIRAMLEGFKKDADAYDCARALSVTEGEFLLQECNNEFIRGFACAAAIMGHWFQDHDKAQEIVAQGNFTREDLEAAGVERYDIAGIYNEEVEINAEDS